MPILQNIASSKPCTNYTLNWFYWPRRAGGSSCEKGELAFSIVFKSKNLDIIIKVNWDFVFICLSVCLHWFTMDVEMNPYTWKMLLVMGSLLWVDYGLNSSQWWEVMCRTCLPIWLMLFLALCDSRIKPILGKGKSW